MFLDPMKHVCVRSFDIQNSFLASLCCVTRVANHEVVGREKCWVLETFRSEPPLLGKVDFRHRFFVEVFFLFFFCPSATLENPHPPSKNNIVRVSVKASQPAIFGWKAG